MASKNFLRWRVPLHFLVAVVFLVFCQPRAPLLPAGAIVVAIGVAVRSWAAGHLRRDAVLTVSGPYAHLRHPLYLGTLIILIGFAVAGSSLWLAAVLAAYFLLLFLPTIRQEERDRYAGGRYAAYAAQVPALWPRLRPARLEAETGAAPASFDFALYLRNREWRGALGCAAILLLLWLKMSSW